MYSAQHKDGNGEMFEVLTFDNKVQEVEYSTTLHKIEWVAKNHGLDTQKHKEYIRAKEIFKSCNP